MLLLAARHLATSQRTRDGHETLAQLAENDKALKSLLKDSGLAPLATEMEREAEDAINFTHPGPARDDAVALFRQVAPVALSDLSILADTSLDPNEACNRMIATIKTSPQGRDFTQTTLAERYFREIALPALRTLAQPDR